MRYLVAPCGLMKEDYVNRTKIPFPVEEVPILNQHESPIPEPEDLVPAAGHYVCRVVNDPRVTEAGIHIPEAARSNQKDYLRARIIAVGPGKDDKKPRYEKGMVVVTAAASGLVMGMENYKPIVLLVSEEAIIAHVMVRSELQ